MLYQTILSVSLFAFCCSNSVFAESKQVELISVETPEQHQNGDANIPQLSEHELKESIKKFLRILVPIFENNCALTIQRYNLWMHKNPELLQEAHQKYCLMSLWREGMRSLLGDIGQNPEFVQLISTLLAQTGNKELEYWRNDWNHNIGRAYRLVETGSDQEDFLQLTMLLEIGLSPEQAFQAKFGCRLIVLFCDLQEIFEEDELCANDYIPEQFMRAVLPLQLLEVLRDLDNNVARKGSCQKDSSIDLQRAKDFLRAYKEVLDEAALLVATEVFKKMSVDEQPKELTAEIFMDIVFSKADEVLKRNNTKLMSLSAELLPRTQNCIHKALLRSREDYYVQDLVFQSALASKQPLEMCKIVLYSDYLLLLSNIAYEYSLESHDVSEDIKHCFVTASSFTASA